MPNTTVNFGLPYPAPSDDPCDFAQQWCEFTGAINDIMTTFQSGIDRAIPVVPAALIRSSIVRSVVNLHDIPFNEVVLDTAAMTDLDADPFHITITRPGRYTIGGYIEKPSSGVVNAQLTLQTSIGDPQWQILDRAGGLTYSIPTYIPVRTLAAGTQIALVYDTSLFAGAENIDVAWLCAFWHSDTEAPI